jgi:hypothetical protein
MFFDFFCKNNWYDYGAWIYDTGNRVRSLIDHKARKYMLFSNSLQIRKTRGAVVIAENSA